jgi:hypothetical protein
MRVGKTERPCEGFCASVEVADDVRGECGSPAPDCRLLDSAVARGRNHDIALRAAVPRLVAGPAPRRGCGRTGRHAHPRHEERPRGTCGRLGRLRDQCRHEPRTGRQDAVRPHVAPRCAGGPARAGRGRHWRCGQHGQRHRPAPAFRGVAMGAHGRPGTVAGFVPSALAAVAATGPAGRPSDGFPRQRVAHHAGRAGAAPSAPA